MSDVPALDFSRVGRSPTAGGSYAASHPPSDDISAPGMDGDAVANFFFAPNADSYGAGEDGEDGAADGELRMLDLNGMSPEDRQRFYDWLLYHNVRFEGRPGDDGLYKGLVFIPEHSASHQAALQHISPPRASSPSRHGPRSPQDGSQSNRSNMSMQSNASNQSISMVPRNASYQATVEQIRTRYPNFYSKLESALEDGMSARKRAVSWLVRATDEIYDTRFVFETTAEGGPDYSFPDFVHLMFENKYRLQKLVYQNAWDLVYNVEVHRAEVLQAETFARFLEESYDTTDMRFFLSSRNQVLKNLHISPLKRSAINDVSLNYSLCTSLSRTIFREAQIQTEFLAVIKAFLEGKRKERHDPELVDLAEFLHLALLQNNRARIAARNAGSPGRGRTTIVREPVRASDAHIPVVTPTQGERALVEAAAEDPATQPVDIVDDNLIGALREATSAAHKTYMRQVQGLSAEKTERISTTIEKDLHHIVASILSGLLPRLNDPVSLSTAVDETEGYHEELRLMLRDIVALRRSLDPRLETAQLNFAHALLQSPALKKDVQHRLNRLVTSARATNDDSTTDARASPSERSASKPAARGNNSRVDTSNIDWTKLA